MPVERARVLCHGVTMKDLNANCVFDVASTGDEIFAKGYLLAQELRLYGTAVKLTGSLGPARQDRLPDDNPDHPLVQLPQVLRLTATVSPLTSERPTPSGTVIFHIDGVPMRRPGTLDGRGRAH